MVRTDQPSPRCRSDSSTSNGAWRSMDSSRSNTPGKGVPPWSNLAAGIRHSKHLAASHGRRQRPGRSKAITVSLRGQRAVRCARTTSRGEDQSCCRPMTRSLRSAPFGKATARGGGAPETSAASSPPLSCWDRLRPTHEVVQQGCDVVLRAGRGQLAVVDVLNDVAGLRENRCKDVNLRPARGLSQTGRDNWLRQMPGRKSY